MTDLTSAIAFIHERKLAVHTSYTYKGHYSIVLTFNQEGITLQAQAESPCFDHAIVSAVAKFQSASRGVDTRPALEHKAASPLSDDIPF